VEHEWYDNNTALQYVETDAAHIKEIEKIIFNHPWLSSGL